MTAVAGFGLVGVGVGLVGLLGSRPALCGLVAVGRVVVVGPLRSWPAGVGLVAGGGGGGRFGGGAVVVRVRLLPVGGRGVGGPGLALLDAGGRGRRCRGVLGRLLVVRPRPPAPAAFHHGVPSIEASPARAGREGL
ncbi:hypothetical protein ASE41_24320 [Streptomyces sp. Root264]|nr:hypothetical protein ASE41_24320 [Streptomyces sp. Root264]